METGKVRSVYCHFDGYPEGVGKTLVEHYQDREKVEKLIGLGALSVLGETIGRKVKFDGFKDTGRQCLAYHRDRGEPLDIGEHDSVEAFYQEATEGWEEYAYLYRQGVWFYTELGGEAGPFLVNARDPNGELPANWKNLAGALQFDNAKHTPGYVFATGGGAANA